ncbi:hypothetical protein C7S20_08585 [Christiangramia fulva]|uniref:Uncharacterized protein n=1 Tax=Christiangramia fulva TaxID=2126553 RepID=A0A2R3Z504_9FLAO|nr:hypothetical protein [Christiangramia fulva]AVR45318.1 hypothetical protein C7S20_08585 [Christiangramia fulva]
MEPGKNPETHLSRKWILFLQIGFIIVLFLTLQAIQWESKRDKRQSTTRSGEEPIVEETLTLNH